MANKPDKRRKIDIEHLRAEIPGSPNSSLEKTIYEQRGIRDCVIDVFNDPRLTIATAVLKGTPADTFAIFREAADHWLAEAGELKYSAIIDLAEKAKSESPDAGESEIDNFVFRLWAARVAEKHGYLSPAAIAANFVSSSDYLHRCVAGNQELLNAVYAFADAWHWFHLEGKGEHELAALGLKSAAGRAVGPDATHQQAERKRRVVEDTFRAFAADPSHASKLTSVKATAYAMLSDINATLEKLKLRPFKAASLEKALRPLLASRKS